jgi:signal transduction histidine kinase
VRRRILLTLLASTSIVLIAFLVPLMVIMGDFAVDRAQRHVVLEIQPLISRIPVVDDSDLADLVASTSAQTGRPATLYLADETAIGVSRPPDAAVELARERGAFFAEVPGGRDLLVPVYTDDGEAVLRVYIPGSELTGAVARARITLAGLGLLLLALSVGLGLLLARAFLRPIGELSRTAGRLGAGDLTARVPASDIREIDTAGRALNRMAGRIVELLGLEREEVADLAHRLRTPVAALRLDAESLPLGDPTERLRTDVDHLERMVDEVIREARRPLREQAPTTADLCRVATERTAFWAVLAEDQNRAMSVDVAGRPLFVACDSRDLGHALDALIGNVFSHTDEGVAFRVSVGTGDGPLAWLEVCDDGPGIPEADVLVRGRSDSGSTGLGLDIARRVAERAGGTIELGSAASGGACVRMYLRPAGPAVVTA